MRDLPAERRTAQPRHTLRPNPPPSEREEGVRLPLPPCGRGIEGEGDRRSSRSPREASSASRALVARESLSPCSGERLSIIRRASSPTCGEPFSQCWRASSPKRGEPRIATREQQGAAAPRPAQAEPREGRTGRRAATPLPPPACGRGMASARAPFLGPKVVTPPQRAASPCPAAGAGPGYRLYRNPVPSTLCIRTALASHPHLSRLSSALVASCIRASLTPHPHSSRFRTASDAVCGSAVFVLERPRERLPPSPRSTTRRKDAILPLPPCGRGIQGEGGRKKQLLFTVVTQDPAAARQAGLGT